MDQLQFRVSAELKNILGRDLITSDNIAVLELVKNSYDAHATKVEITFGNDSIVIADNGKGMSAADISDKWLFIAYSAKSDGTEDDNYRSKIRRDFAGAKGIGRLSCDRLARYLIMKTVSEETGRLETLKVDWAKFENRQTEEMDTISVEYESSDSSFAFPDSQPHGTSLTFTGLHGNWGVDEILNLRKFLEKMIAPLSGADNFNIEVKAPNFTDYDNQLKRQIEDAQLRYDNLSEREKADVAKWENSILNGPIRNSISDVLKIKTTQIESVLREGKIVTKLTDRGVLMYEIEEENKYPQLEKVKIDLYFLNRAAKYNFSLLMGMSPVNYGNVFLFRNGIRILPYGEYNDDSWGLNQRRQQGFNRKLGTRDLFGRVDVHSDKVDKFKEVSSRDGGLINSPERRQLLGYFNEVERRLERYVSGVLWGEAFLRNDYFQNERQALKARKEIQNDKDSDNPEGIIKNIGSRIDFLNLIKSLVNDNGVTVRYYNSSLADVLADVTEAEVLNSGFLDDLRKVAEKTNDSSLFASIGNFEQYLNNLQKKREEAERRAEEEKKRREEEEQLRKRAEAELEAKTKQNLFLQSLGALDKERIIKYHHDIRLQSLTIQNVLSRISKQVWKNDIDIEKLKKNIELIAKANDRVISIAQFATKANFNTTGDSIEADLVSFVYDYIKEVLVSFYGDVRLECRTNGCSLVKTYRPLEINLMIDNLLSNSLKAEAKNFVIEFSQTGEWIEMHVKDDGKGLDKSIASPADIFQKGFTTTNGSGIGLFSISQTLEKELGGVISYDPSFRYSTEKKGFKLIIRIPL
jgi:signal transduction histidine kinase